MPAPVQTTLRPPDARQGPGPMPGAIVDALDPAINRLISRTLPGNRRASGVGVGTELAQMRPYEPGDDVRQIDASASARTGTMHVRVQVPERALTTWVVLDLSPSMAFGTSRRLKADVAEGVALVFARLGVRHAGSVGVVAFGAPEGARILPPRGSKRGMIAVQKLLSEGVAVDGQPHPHGLADALGRLLRLGNQPGLVVVISDFRDQSEWERPLGALRLRHAMIAIDVADPRESELPALGRLALVDPETGAVVHVNSSNRRLRERFEALEHQRRATVAAEFRRLGIRHIQLSTDQDWLVELGRRI
jgi:uncharacterized protein (DUF58 family)